MNLVELVKHAGVIGAGGGRFPTQVKLGVKTDPIITPNPQYP